MSNELTPVPQVPGKTPEERAAWLENFAKRACQHYRYAGLALGWAFYEVVSEGYWSQLGFGRFEEFLDQQGVDMKYDAAKRLMRCYNQWCVVSGYKPEEIADIGISKLDVAQRYLGREKPKQLILLARENPRAQLIDLLNETYDEDEKATKGDKLGPVIKLKCPQCGHSWRQEVNR